VDEEQLELSLKEGQSGENKSEDKTPIESTQVKANMSSLKDNQLDNELAENLEDNEKSEQQPNSNSADENSVKLANSKQSTVSGLYSKIYLVSLRMHYNLALGKFF
jgi:hypothetical protein